MNIKRQRLYPEWKDAFYKRFPYLFADVLTGAEAVSPITEWGIECRPGWKKIVERLCVELEALIHAIPEAERKDYRMTQCKQKFGTLRLYMSKYTEAMTKKIDAAELESTSVCEACGGPDREDKPCPTKH